MPSSPAHPEHHLLLLLSALPKYSTLCRAGGPPAQWEPSCRVFSRICSPWRANRQVLHSLKVLKPPLDTGPAANWDLIFRRCQAPGRQV